MTHKAAVYRPIVVVAIYFTPRVVSVEVLGGGGGGEPTSQEVCLCVYGGGGGGRPDLTLYHQNCIEGGGCESF